MLKYYAEFLFSPMLYYFCPNAIGIPIYIQLHLLTDRRLSARYSYKFLL